MRDARVAVDDYDARGDVLQHVADRRQDPLSLLAGGLVAVVTTAVLVVRVGDVNVDIAVVVVHVLSRLLIAGTTSRLVVVVVVVVAIDVVVIVVVVDIAVLIVAEIVVLNAFVVVLVYLLSQLIVLLSSSLSL